MGLYYGDGFRIHCIGTSKEFVIWPRKCYRSGKTIWLEYAYKRTAMYTGPGDPEFENRWYNSNQYIVAKLLGEV
jgi:hypothetical protein